VLDAEVTMSDARVLEIRAAPKRRRRVVALRSEAWLIAHDVTLDRVEERLLRAVLTMTVLTDPDARFRVGYKSSMPTVVPDCWEAWRQYDSEDIREAQTKAAHRFDPSNADTSDAEGNRPTKPFSWVKGFAKHDIDLIRLRAFGFGFSTIAARWNVSRQYVQKVYRELMMRVWDAAMRQAAEAHAAAIANGQRGGAGKWSGLRLRDSGDGRVEQPDHLQARSLDRS
jgi:hypothetical protein